MLRSTTSDDEFVGLGPLKIDIAYDAKFTYVLPKVTTRIVNRPTVLLLDPSSSKYYYYYHRNYHPLYLSLRCLNVRADNRIVNN